MLTLELLKQTFNKFNRVKISKIENIENRIIKF